MKWTIKHRMLALSGLSLALLAVVGLAGWVGTRRILTTRTLGFFETAARVSLNCSAAPKKNGPATSYTSTPRGISSRGRSSSVALSSE